MTNKTAYRLIGVLIVLYHIPIFLVYMFENRFVYMPKPLENSYRYNCLYDCQEFMLSTPDTEELNVIHLSPKDSAKARLIYYHGNSRNIKLWLPEIQSLLKRGYELVLMDYSGYGKSSGSPQEDIIYEDAQFVFDWSLSNLDTLDVIIYGRSLGSSIASYVAQTRNAKALALEAPFFDMEDVIRRRGMIFYWPFEFDNQFDTHKYISNVDYPVIAIHGTEDWIVPIESFNRLVNFESDKINYTIVPGGGHNDLDIYDEFQDFLDKLDNTL